MNYIELVKFGVKKRIPGYSWMKLYQPGAFAGNLSTRDLQAPASEKLQEEVDLLKKFFKRYPEIKMMPFTGPTLTLKGGSMLFQHPASKFIHQIRVLKKQGYSDYKAFEIVGQQIEEVIQKQTDETRILRGVALQSNVYTYLERVQQIAEAESSMKVKKLERDLPKFLRAQRHYIKEFEDEEKRINEQAA